MSRTKRFVLFAWLLATLGYALVYGLGKERILSSGQLVLLELVPVDPRSLLQGDYMDLRYAITQGISASELPTFGYLIVRLDGRGVGRLVRTQDTPDGLAAGEYAIRVRRRDAGAMNRGGLRIGTESYFFEEGKAGVFASARYGGLRLDGRGGVVLEGLYGEDLRLLQ